MSLDQTANFQRAEITQGFPMAAGDGDVYFIGADEFPDPANGAYNLVIFDQTQHSRPDQDPNVEIVRATSRISNVELGVDRAQEGTSAVDHPAGSAVILAPTSKMFDDIAADIANVQSNVSANNSDINNLQNDVSANDSDISGLQNDINLLPDDFVVSGENKQFTVQINGSDGNGIINFKTT